MNSLLPLTLFAFVSSITPGPNNLMLTTSGTRFGFARSIPHMLGITVGFGVMLALCAAGIGNLLIAAPLLQVVLRSAGSAYLVYLTWQLRSIVIHQGVDREQRPMTFFGAAIFQFANPKAWVMAVTGAAAFLPPIQPVIAAIGLFCLIFCAVNLPCISVWAGIGAALRRHLTQPKWQRVFCVVMVCLTLYSAVAIWL